MATKEARKKRVWRPKHRDAPRETAFQDRVMRDLRKVPTSWWEKINDRVTIGILDILGGVNGYSFVIELKTKSQLTVKQYSNLQKADRANCQSFCATPENWEEIYSYIWSFTKIAPPHVASLRKPARIPLWTIPPKLRERFPQKA